MSGLFLTAEDGSSALPPVRQVIRQPAEPSRENPAWQDPLAGRIGFRLSQLMEELGSPRSVMPSRGEEAFQDTVIFYYPDHSYAYLLDDRVWQIRLDRRFQGIACGVRMGLDKAAVQAILGPPAEDRDTWMRWDLPETGGWPMELILYFGARGLEDFYLRRGDY